jgi:hypothetical protein
MSDPGSILGITRLTITFSPNVGAQTQTSHMLGKYTITELYMLSPWVYSDNTWDRLCIPYWRCLLSEVFETRSALDFEFFRIWEELHIHNEIFCEGDPSFKRLKL